jgi:4-aminobutyrate aminotransferase-like enzyme
MFAIEHTAVVPDLITMAKSLAGGFPLSAAIGRADIMDAVAPGGLGGTYGGNPIACAAALAVLRVIEEKRLFNQDPELAAWLKLAQARWVLLYRYRLAAWSLARK